MGHLSAPYHLVPAHYINIGCISLRAQISVLVFFNPCNSWPKIDNMSNKSWIEQVGMRLHIW